MSSGLTPEERARSLLLPTTDQTEGVPRERADSQEQGDEGQGDSSSVSSTVEYPHNNAADLVILNDRSWCLLSDISKLASNTSSFSFVVLLDGITDLSHEETSLCTHLFLASMTNADPQESFSYVGAALARTIAPSGAESQAYRVSGSRPSSSKPKTKNRARK